MYYLIISITNKRLLRQKTGGACLYVPQDRYWLGSFDAIPPTPKVDFSAAKKKNPQENYFFRLVSAGIIQVKMAFFRRFFLKFCQTDLDSRKQQAILLKQMKKIMPKLRGRVSAKILSRRSRLSRTTSNLTRLIRPRPRSGIRTAGEDFPDFCRFILFEHRQKKCFYQIPDLVMSSRSTPQKKPLTGFS